MSAEVTVSDVVEHAQVIANGEHDTVKPGMPMSFSEACDVGEMIWQGDFGIGLTDGGVPEGYVQKPISELPGLCLVPGRDQTIGSKHCLSSAEGVEVFVPSSWNEESLDGPYLRLSNPNGTTVTHPKHGDVTIPSCFTEVQIMYQREWDEELKRERRAAD